MIKADPGGSRCNRGCHGQRERDTGCGGAETGGRDNQPRGVGASWSWKRQEMDLPGASSRDQPHQHLDSSPGRLGLNSWLAEPQGINCAM